MATHNVTARVQVAAVGASAGGIEALRDLVADLPADFAGAILVVLHLSPNATSVLPQILARAGALPALHAEDAMQLEGGRIYAAPPDCHLLVGDGRLRLDHGPRTNGHRPAIDPLFRSVAEAYGDRGAGVVLSGVLDDGVAGLMAIKQAGGLTLVQDPSEALYEMMPRNAIELVAPEHVGTARELGRVLAAAAAVPPDGPPAAASAGAPREHLVEVDRGSSDSPQPGAPTGLTCPECNGGIWLDDSQTVAQLACRTGHRYSPETFAAAQTERVETALWTALRTLEERAALYRRMAARRREAGNVRTAERFALRAESAVQHAYALREVIEQFNDVREDGAA